MWEDKFTAVFKFRARWLVHAAGVPEDALARLRASRKGRIEGNDSTCGVCSALPQTDGKPSRVNDGDAAPAPPMEGGVHVCTSSLDNEVFLSTRTEDLDIRDIVKPVILSVTTLNAHEQDTDPGATISPGAKPTGLGNVARLTHTFSPSDGGRFFQLPASDPILVRARIVQAQAEAASASADKESPLPQKQGKNEDETIQGWLPNKSVVRSLATRGRGRGRGRAVSGRQGRLDGFRAWSLRGARGLPRSPTSCSSVSEQQDWSDDSDSKGGRSAPSNASDEAWEASDDGVSNSDSDSDLALDFANSYGSPILSVSRKKDPRHASKRKNGKDDSRRRQTQRRRNPQRSSRPRFSPREGGAVIPNADAWSSSIIPPLTRNTTHHSSRCPRVPTTKRQGPLSPRPRRLSMPPVPGANVEDHNDSASASDTAATVPAPTTMVSRGTGFSTNTHVAAVTRIGSVYCTQRRSPAISNGDAKAPASYVSGKRKRGGGVGADAGAGSTSEEGGASMSQGDGCRAYPPRRTPMGKNHQADIPELLQPGQREASPVGREAARLVRRARNWIITEGRRKKTLMRWNCTLPVVYHIFPDNWCHTCGRKDGRLTWEKSHSFR